MNLNFVRLKKIFENLLNSNEIYMSFFNIFLWLSLDKALRIILGLLVSILMARYFGPTLFGTYNYITSIISFFLILATLGLNNIAVRDLVMEPKKIKEIVSSMFLLKTFFSFLIYILLFITIVFSSSFFDSQIKLLLIFCGSLLLAKPSDIFRYYFESKGNFKKIVIIESLIFVSVSILRVLFVWQSLPLIYFIGALVLENFLFYIFILIAYSRHEKFCLFLDFKLMFIILKQAVPLILSGLAVIAYMQIDQIMLKHMINDKSVGIYSIGTRFVSFWYFLPALTSMSFFPQILKMKKNDQVKYLKFFQINYDLNLFLAFLIIIPTFFLSKFIILLLYGSQFIESIPILQISIFNLIFIFLGTVRGKWLIAEKLQNIDPLIHIAGAGINIILNILLIPKYGAIGASLATLFSSFFSIFIIPIFFKKLRLTSTMMLKSFINIFHFKYLKKYA